MNNFAIYLRVSTKKQGKSGLGLDAQRKMCQEFIANHGGTCLQEFVDVESGTHRNRKGLQDAIAYCKANNCALVIAKLDRLARDVEFCFKVVNTGIAIHFTDMPQMNTLLLGVFAAVAQYERELTSDRTKKALAVKKSQGAKLGASSDKYWETRKAQSEEETQKMFNERGETKTSHFQNSRDVKAFIRILRNVFPNATSNEPSKWNWRLVTMRNGNKEKVLALMKDYKALDSTLFASWNLNGDAQKLTVKLCAYIQSIRRSFTNN